MITKLMEKKFPALYSYDGKSPEEVPVFAKFFDPSGRFTFFATEGEVRTSVFAGVPDDFIMFGLTVSASGGMDDELGYVSLNELKKVRGTLGLGIERDLHLGEMTLADAMAA